MEQLGPEMLCFASDYLHPEGLRDPVGKFEAAMEDVSQADLDAFFAGTIVVFLGRDLIQLVELAGEIAR